MNGFYAPRRAMAIVAHPDDIEFSCSGTLARWAKAGAKISYVLCTSGDVGIDEPGMTRAAATQIREAEQRAAAEIAGASEVVFLREPDGLLQPTLDLRKRLVREIRRFRPEVIVTGDPTVVWAGDDYINHPDHRAAATAALDATFPAAGQPNLFEELGEEGLRAHKPRKVYVSVWDAAAADLFVNIEETIGVKIAALRAHSSQMKDWDPEPSVREWAAQAAKGKEMAYAEAYRVITLVDDATWDKLIRVYEESDEIVP
ncbi:MAG TPA: PIG-L deacetylase family protein [Anaerolineaceae bacterium]|jgi:LmbE family N-acetylglucosaminyl deacetylase|nr:PIG-L deacetylase family protein [Anaerolineaceae bacterium]